QYRKLQQDKINGIIDSEYENQLNNRINVNLLELSFTLENQKTEPLQKNVLEKHITRIKRELSNK
ncbi:MAG: hypothetical protein AAFY36_18575, partial [Bacteroidota bacterium]